MESYLVIKRVNLLVGSKTYRQNAIITADMVGQEKIDRYLARGYIRALGVDPVAETLDDDEASLNLTGKLTDEDDVVENPESSNSEDGLPNPEAEEFLSEEEINELPRPKLLEYAEEIGLTCFPTNIKITDLRELVEQFIQNELDDGSDTDDDDNDSDDNKPDSDEKSGGESA